MRNNTKSEIEQNIIFDADRGNNGKGILVEDLIKFIKSLED
jgi:hypothetical protein